MQGYWKGRMQAWAWATNFFATANARERWCTSSTEPAWTPSGTTPQSARSCSFSTLRCSTNPRRGFSASLAFPCDNKTLDGMGCVKSLKASQCSQHWSAREKRRRRGCNATCTLAGAEVTPHAPFLGLSGCR